MRRGQEEGGAVRWKFQASIVMAVVNAPSMMSSFLA